jgi:hypothetical protein
VPRLLAWQRRQMWMIGATPPIRLPHERLQIAHLDADAVVIVNHAVPPIDETNVDADMLMRKNN